MRIFHDLDELRRATTGGPGSVVTIGVYDGVHLGHRAVLRVVRDLASARGMDAVCVTFDRHPAEVVRPESAPLLLTDTAQKLELLEASGYLDGCFVLHFDKGMSHQPADAFVRDVLVGAAHAGVVVVGADFHFGRGRGGNVPMLQAMGAELGFGVLGVGLEAGGSGEIYSSTGIRRLVAAGDVAGAEQQLGRAFELRGPVIDGDHRGRELGFPTANVAIGRRMCLPADGIYAGTLTAAEGVARPAAISLGRRPTFYEHAEGSLLEAFVLDWEGDLYGQQVKVRFVERLRGEERFDSVEALVAQMNEDVETTRKIVTA
jgi:riboflavin kinase/FMN adenylyltransferase